MGRKKKIIVRKPIREFDIFKMGRRGSITEKTAVTEIPQYKPRRCSSKDPKLDML